MIARRAVHPTELERRYQKLVGDVNTGNVSAWNDRV